jgi:hypothetical protein
VKRQRITLNNGNTDVDNTKSFYLRVKKQIENHSIGDENAS